MENADYILLLTGDRVPAAPGKYRLTTPPDLNKVADQRFLLEYVSPFLTVREYHMSSMGSVQRCEVGRQVHLWKKHNPEIGGFMFFHCAGYQLTTKDQRAWLVPDAAYIDQRTFDSVATGKTRYSLCVPAVVLQYVTKKDNLQDALAKVSLFMEAGTREGVIIDVRQSCAWIYTQGGDEPRCEPLGAIAFSAMPGFTLDCSAIRTEVERAGLL